MIPWHAILRFHEALLLCLGAALLYGWLLRRLAEVMHWRRMRLAEIGEKYLTLDLSWTERRQVEFYLNNAFNPWAMIVVSGLLPPLLIYQIVNGLTTMWNSRQMSPPKMKSAGSSPCPHLPQTRSSV